MRPTKWAVLLQGGTNSMLNKEEIINNAEQIDGWMSREELSFLFDSAYKYLKPGDSACEIGTWKGRSAFVVGSVCKDVGCTLISIDTFAGSPDKGYDTYRQALENPNLFFETYAKKALDGLPVKFIKLDSKAAAEQIPDIFLSMCFIDGDHEMPTVAIDIDNYWKKVKYGGLFCGHDYFDNPEGCAVKTAVDNRFGALPSAGSIWYIEKHENIL